MKKSKKIAIIAGGAVATAGLLAAGSFAFFIDKDWTSDTVTAGTVDISIDDFNLTNALNINPGDGDVSVYNSAVAAGTTDTLRQGTEHKMTFTVNNNGTKSVLTRNLITITVENLGYEPVAYGETAKNGDKYSDCSVKAPDGLIYYVDTSHPIEIQEDDLFNKWIKGTIVEYDSVTGYYKYTEPDTGLVTRFNSSDNRFNNIVHWPTVSLPADVFGVLYNVEYAKDTLPSSHGVEDYVVTKSNEIDCVPTTSSNTFSGTDLYALHSKDIAAGFEDWSRTYYSSTSNAIAIRYVTPQITLTAVEGSIEDNDGLGASQNALKTNGGEVVDGDLDSVYYTYWLEMIKESPNIYQGATVHLDVEVQAMQFRNTTDEQWKTLHKQSYALTVENAATSYTSVQENN